MCIIYVIEEIPRIFTLLQNILSRMRKEKYIFADGKITLSEDIKKFFSDDGVLIFQLIDPSDLKVYETDFFTHVNLAFAGFTDKKIDINDFPNIDSLMLNAENLNKIKNTESVKQVITCGIREKDTITFSSIEENSIILNVQRTIKNIEGKTAEPFEKKIYIPDISDEQSGDTTREDLITALSVLLFCDML